MFAMVVMLEKECLDARISTIDVETTGNDNKSYRAQRSLSGMHHGASPFSLLRLML